MNNTYWELIAKHLGGGGNSKENQDVERLLLTDASFKQAYDEALIIWKTAPASYQKYRTALSKPESSAFNDILLAIDDKANAMQSEHKNHTLTYSKGTNRRKWIFTGIAASFILIVGVFFSLQQTTPVDEADFISSYFNPKGAKTINVSLPDGSIVCLLGGTSLEVDPENKRQVSIVGEAIFNVAKNTENPFIVFTPSTKIKVLGTVFSIQAYKQAKREIVTVTEGKVSFKAGSESLVLTANQSASYLNNTQEFTEITEVTLPTNPQDYIIFNDIELATAVVILENYFDKKIVIENNDIAERKIYGRFSKESLSDILQSISLALDIQYVVNEKEILFKSR